MKASLLVSILAVVFAAVDAEPEDSPRLRGGATEPVESLHLEVDTTGKRHLSKHKDDDDDKKYTYYTIKLRFNSFKCLSAASSSVVVADCQDKSSSQQQWIYESKTIRPKLHPALCLTFTGADQPVQLLPCTAHRTGIIHEFNKQRWSFDHFDRFVSYFRNSQCLDTGDGVVYTRACDSASRENQAFFRNKV